MGAKGNGSRLGNPAKRAQATAKANAAVSRQEAASAALRAQLLAAVPDALLAAPPTWRDAMWP
jgi:hypothetical protein